MVTEGAEVADGSDRAARPVALNGPLSVGQWLAAARTSGVARLDAHRLLAHHLNCEPAWLIAHDDHRLPAPVRSAADADLARRASGVPLAHLVGWREFRGLRLSVTADVLVPRPETELLVDWALELAERAPAPTCLDLGTGSGAIALAFKQAASSFAVHGSDLSEAALAVAKDNAQQLRLPVTWHQGPWWQPFLGMAPFGLVLSNPPYVAEGDPHLAALDHEPRLALTSGLNGTAALREIAAGAPAHLLPGGWLLLEHGFDQGEAVSQLLQGLGFMDVATRCDLAGWPRCSGGRWPGH